jgi:hypothetical protein
LGLTAEFSLYLPHDKIVHGLWKSDLCFQLLWRSPTPTVDHKPPDQPPSWKEFPSWSWLSANGSVEWGRSDDDLGIAELLEMTSNITCIKSALVRIELSYRTAQRLWDLYYFSGIVEAHPVAVFAHDEPTSLRIEHEEAIRLLGKRESLFYIDPWFKKFHMFSTDSEDHGSQDHIARYTSTCMCLLLWKDPSLEPGVYRRVGVVEVCFANAPDITQINEFVKAATVITRFLPPADYIERDEESGQVTIGLA